ncbi:MAG: hypothetical protein KA369_23070 [Spirochaetes bacterium]|nr:hypothetical protein [Spirochaetota bacterium]
MTRTCCAEIALIVQAVQALPDSYKAPAAGKMCLAGIADISDTLRELTDVMQGIHNVISGFTFISDTIGFGTILLFIAVIVLSAGYSALGMPRGKASFFSSLATADALWIFWKASFSTPPSEYLFSVVRANLIVLCPLIIAAIVSWAAPSLQKKISSRMSSLFRKNKSMGPSEAAALIDEYQERGARLNRAFLDDILASGEAGGAVSLSGETLKRLEELGDTLKKIDAASR